MSVNRNKLIPSFIEARTPKGLRALMIQNNIKQHGHVEYYNVYSYKNDKGKSRHIAWFYVILDSSNAKEILDNVETK